MSKIIHIEHLIIREIEEKITVKWITWKQPL